MIRCSRHTPCAVTASLRNLLRTKSDTLEPERRQSTAHGVCLLLPHFRRSDQQVLDVAQPGLAAILVRLTLVVLIIVWASSPVIAQRPPRYVAVLADGARIESNTLTDWQSSEPQPKLDDHLIFDAANPVVWMRDRSVVVTEAQGPLVEFLSGDRLPGEVLAFRRGDENIFDLVPAHFEVKPLFEMRPPSQQEPRFIRAVASQIRKIIWERGRRNHFEPRTVFLRNGGKVGFRAIRFNESQIQVLVDADFRRISFSNIAELHLAPDDWWHTNFDELAILSPDGSQRLVQIESLDGLVATSSVGRFASLGQGGANEPHRWVHGWQPAWSLDVLWIPASRVFQWRMFGPTEIPLVRLPIQRFVHQPLIANEMPVQISRNVLAAPLSSGGKEFAWGFGVPSNSELYFDLHPSVQSFRSGYGLDNIVGFGGCVKFSVRALPGDGLPRDVPLFESPFVVGSGASADTGIVNLTSDTPKSKRLLLNVDAAHSERPSGADALDIRDFANWLDPLLQLNVDKLRDELRRRVFQQMPAWRDWYVYSEPGGGAKRVSVREDGPANAREFRPAVAAIGAPIVLTQRREFSPLDRWLALGLTRSQNSSSIPKLEVYLDSEYLGEFEPTLFDRAHRDFVPILVPLGNHLSENKTIEVTLRQLPDAQAIPLRWSGVQFGRYPPTVFSVFDDDMVGNESHLLSVSYSGRKSLRVAKGKSASWPIAKQARIRERPGLGEFRYLRLAVKAVGEGRIGVRFSPPNSEAPFVFDAGTGPALTPDAKRISNSNWKQDDWVVVTRDLFADFGSCELSQCTFEVVEPEHACLDHVFLARAQSDFDYLSVDGVVPNDRRQAEPQLPQTNSDRLPNSIVRISFDQRACYGVAITAQDILVPGQAIVSPNQEVTARLSDGDTITGKSLGVFRSQNIGLVRIDSSHALTPIQIGAPNRVGERVNIESHKSLIPTVDSDERRIHSLAVQVERVDTRTITTTWQPGAEWSLGTLLWNSNGHVLGLAIRRSTLGGLVFARLDGSESLLPRLIKGEIWGEWPIGAAPDPGFSVARTAEGLEVVSVLSNGPARSTVRIGDLVQRINDVEVSTPRELHAVLSKLDPGTKIYVSLVRDDNELPTRIELTRPTP